MNLRKLLIIALILIFPLICRSQEIVAGWTFKKGINSELSADTGTVYNKHICKLEALDTNGVHRAIEFKNGIYAPNDYAAMSQQWDKGSNKKFWQIVFISKGYENLTLFSKQMSGESRTGPKYFQPQYKFGSSDWMDIPDSKLIEVANDWTTGVIDNLTLPATLANLNDSIYIRWLMITNINIDGDSVYAIGTSKIDDIFILGTPAVGVEEFVQGNSNRVFPNVSSGLFTITAGNNIKEVIVYNSLGSLVNKYPVSNSGRIDLSKEPEGMYFVAFRNDKGVSVRTEKIIHVK
jgi:hypothetical protein